MVIMRQKSMSLTCQRRREEELTGCNGTRDFFWTGYNGTYLGHGDIVIRRRVCWDWL